MIPNAPAGAPRARSRRTALLARAAVALALGAAATVSTAPVAAQPAAALGRPLPDAKLAAGTISVRVVAGSPSSPVVGTEVTLLVGGEPRVARTDPAGRATFSGLTGGTMVQAKVLDEDKKEVLSEPFPVPGQGGARLMLSTKPFQGMAGMPAAGGAGGMPEARQMSGQPRPDRMTPPGTYVVRVTYNDLVMKDGAVADPSPPVGVPVMLAGYSADDTVSIVVKQTTDQGVATFEGLDQSGGTSYFALASLPRNGAHDRLIAVPTVLDGQAGIKVVLSGDKQDAATPPIDDYGKLIPRDATVLPPNQVRITIDGVPTSDTQVTVFDAATRKPLAVGPTKRNARPDPTQVRGGANYDPRADLPAGKLEIEIRGGAGTATDPMAGISVQLVGAQDDQPVAGGTGTTGPDGKLQLELAPQPALAAVKAVLDLNGKQMVSAGMDLSASGGKLEVTAQWPEQGKPEAVFDVPYQPGQVVYAEAVMSQQVFRSLPVATVPGAGSHANIYIYPRTMFTFDTHSFVEDQLLAVQGSFEITNYSWAPYRDSPDGLLIKLPPHHKGAIVAPQDQGDVAVAQGEGFRITRPIPPGGRKFRAGFSMPIEDGAVTIAFDLPLGTWASEMKIRQTPGMTVSLPEGITGQTQMANTGEPWFLIPNITVGPNKPLRLTIAGFPRAAGWSIWAPRIIGITVVMLLLAGIAFALTRKGPAPPVETETRREQLMTELVALEKRGVSSSKDRQRREQIIDELERLWGT